MNKTRVYDRVQNADFIPIVIDVKSQDFKVLSCFFTHFPNNSKQISSMDVLNGIAFIYLDNSELPIYQGILQAISTVSNGRYANITDKWLKSLIITNARGVNHGN